MSDEPRKPSAQSQTPRFGVADLEYELPDRLIAQQPLPERDASRLLVVDRSSGNLSDERIADLSARINPGDLVVMNNTRVVPAKFSCRRDTGGRVRGLFEREESLGLWVVMLTGSKRLRVGEVLQFAAQEGANASLSLVEQRAAGHWLVRIESAEQAETVLSRIGRTPLPPYIRRTDDQPAVEDRDRERYQTIYASRSGAVAAPTAGLHLTQVLLDRMRDRGVETAFVTLHVGVGTFSPIRVADVSKHIMHAEWTELTPETATAIQHCRERGGRVIAIGTTTVRVLESMAIGSEPGMVRAGLGETDLFIYPPYSLQVVDAMLTNFHLPGSTLLAMIMAFANVDLIQRAYRHAVETSYRFYSYGDAMLIL